VKVKVKQKVTAKEQESRLDMLSTTGAHADNTASNATFPGGPANASDSALLGPRATAALNIAGIECDATRFPGIPLPELVRSA